jgi:hypothetical protein
MRTTYARRVLFALATAAAVAAPSPATAQVGGDTGMARTTAPVEEREDGPDLGWIGLLGLAGLLGLRRKDHVAHVDTTTTRRP